MAPKKPAVPVETLESVKKAPAEDPTPTAPPAPEVVATTATAPAAGIAPHLLHRYRVKTTTTISLFGQFCVLAADSVVSVEGYGPTGLQRIIDCNVPLEKVD